MIRHYGARFLKVFRHLKIQIGTFENPARCLTLVDLKGSYAPSSFENLTKYLSACLSA